MQPSGISSPKPSKTSILLAEDHALFSEGIHIVLESTGLYEPIYHAKNGKQAVDMVKQHRPEIILMDIAMPELNGLEASNIIKIQYPATKIIMLTSFTDARSVQMALSCGMEGYCSKEIDSSRLLSVIQLVLEGAIYLDPAIANFVLQNWFKKKPGAPSAPSNKPFEMISPSTPKPQATANPTPPTSPTVQPAQTKPVEPAPADEQPATAQTPQPATRPVEKLEIPKATPVRTEILTAREMELLSLVADYRSNEEIAQILSISIDWVNGYLRAIVGKLGVDNEIQSVRRAVEDGAIQKAAILEQSQYQS